MRPKQALFLALGLVALFASSHDLRANFRVTPEELPPQTPTPSAAFQPDAPSPQPVCCQPCITYRYCGPKLCCDTDQPPVPAVLHVKQPCSDCEVEVPICMPACCTGEPKVCCGKGFLGRDVVEYEWECGFRVRVAFKHLGGLVVTIWGC